MSFYRKLKNFNIPKLVMNNCALEELEINVGIISLNKMQK